MVKIGLDGYFWVFGSSRKNFARTLLQHSCEGRSCPTRGAAMSTGSLTTQVSGTRIAIVMPALNEEGAVGRQVLSILAHPGFDRLHLAQIIVVDNGSEDATASVAQAAGATVVRQCVRGYGAACLAGVLAADADVVLLMDADGSDDLDGTARVAALFLEGK